MQLGITTQPDAEGNLWMGLSVQSEEIQVQVYLCRSNNYEQAARELHKKIMDAGREMRKAELGKGLAVVRGGDTDAIIRREAQRGKQLRSGTAGQKRPPSPQGA